MLRSFYGETAVREMANRQQNRPSKLKAARERMLTRHLAARGITCPRVLAAMQRIPRERFVSADAVDAAYDDRALAIACGQTISQPFIVGLMTQALNLTGREHVLEVGTGSGYQTAVAAELAGDVVSIERHAPLSQAGGRLLRDLGCDNVELIVGDGAAGWPAGAPYDRILVTAAAAELPAPLWEQLAEGGLVVAPLGPPEDQLLKVIRKVDGRRQQQVLTACRFVPLRPGLGDAEEADPE